MAASAQTGGHSLLDSGWCADDSDSRGVIQLDVPTSDLQCPICVEVLDAPFMTSCGHSFCHRCLEQHLRTRRNCPSCGAYITHDHMYPNFALVNILRKASGVGGGSSGASQRSHAAPLLERVSALLSAERGRMRLCELDALAQLLADTRDDARQQQASSKLLLLRCFLQHAQGTLQSELEEVEGQLGMLKQDIARLESAQDVAAVAAQQPARPLLTDAAGAAGLPTLAMSSDGGVHGPHGAPAGPGVIIMQGDSGSMSPAAAALAVAAASGASGNVQVHRFGPASVDTIAIDAAARRDAGFPAALTRMLTKGGNGGGGGEATATPPSCAIGHKASTSSTPFDAVAGAVQPRASSSHAPPRRDGGHASSSAAEWPPVVIKEDGEGAAAVEGGACPRVHTSTTAASASSAWQGAEQAALMPPPASGTGVVSATPGAATAHNPAATSQTPPQPLTQVAQVVNGAVAPASAHHPSDRQVGAELGTNTAAASQFGDMPGAAANKRAPGIPAEAADAAGDHLLAKKRRFVGQLDELELAYFSLRRGQTQRTGVGGIVAAAADHAGPSTQPPMAQATTAAVSGAGSVDSLGEFGAMLRTVTQYKSLTQVCEVQLPRRSQPQGATPTAAGAAAPPPTPPANIFDVAMDADEHMFAATLLSRIYVCSYEQVMAGAGVSPAAASGSVTPGAVTEIVTRSKLTCLSYNSAVRQHLVAGDYDGVATLWDTATQQALAELDGHDRRIWTVDFCPTTSGDPTMLITGSDDCSAKVWSTRDESSVATLKVKTNVCSARFNPWDAHQVALGCAGQQCLLFDLRATAQPLATLAGHTKAVSYVRFMSRTEVLTASIDSSLRLWNTPESSAQNPTCVRTYTGHHNEKAFVGLAVNGPFIACGSESNTVFIYSKPVHHPSIRYTLPQGPDSAHVSSLCWRHSSHTLLAANSQGRMWVLRLES